jgi:hypothetical protein
MRPYGTQWYFSLATGLALRIDSSLSCMKALEAGSNSLQYTMWPRNQSCIPITARTVMPSV